VLQDSARLDRQRQDVVEYTMAKNESNTNLRIAFTTIADETTDFSYIWLVDVFLDMANMENNDLQHTVRHTSTWACRNKTASALHRPAGRPPIVSTAHISLTQI